MTTVTQQLKVAKCTDQELTEVREFLQRLNDVIQENEHYEEDSEINKEIADVARTLPYRSFIVPLNLGILLDNYQEETIDLCKGRWSGSELGQLVSAFIGMHFDAKTRIQNYEPCIGYEKAGDESYCYWVKWNKEKLEYEFGVVE